MTDLTARVVTALRAHHDRLAAVVSEALGTDRPGEADDVLAAPSAAAEWRVSDVLSHLGSGAEIMLAPLTAGIDGVPAPEADNQAVWARWDAASPAEQAAWFVQHDARLVETLEALDADQRTSVLVDLGFLPQPVPLVVAAGMRLNEVALHTWDVEAGQDPTASVDEDAAALLVELYTGPLGFLLGFVAKPTELVGAAVIEVSVGQRVQGLVVDADGARLEAESPVAPTATLTATPEELVRLLSGRLVDGYTADDVAVAGDVSLADLRRVFPGF